MIRLCLFAALFFRVSVAPAADFHVYYLGGQSNMDGFGQVSELPEELAEPVEGVWIFHGNDSKDGSLDGGKGLWSELKPGHGYEFVSDGKTNQYSEKFGLELTFAKAMKEQFPDRNIAVIKYSRGGTSIDEEAGAAARFGCWEPDWDGGEGAGKGINQFDHFLATLRNARADKDIDNDGAVDHLIPAGILWMQGESDAIEPEIAAEYEEILWGLMTDIREAFGDPEARIAIGRITDWDVWTHGDVVREAQAEFVKKDGNAALVTSTDNYGNSDKWHYDTPGYIDLGRQFAEAFFIESSRFAP